VGALDPVGFFTQSNGGPWFLSFLSEERCCLLQREQIGQQHEQREIAHGTRGRRRSLHSSPPVEKKRAGMGDKPLRCRPLSQFEALVPASAASPPPGGGEPSRSILEMRDLFGQMVC
jgi:hypothetical protein